MFYGCKIADFPRMKSYKKIRFSCTYLRFQSFIPFFQPAIHGACAILAIFVDRNPKTKYSHEIL